MSLLNDQQIIALGIITPVEKSGPGQISFGPSSYGYDIRLANKFMVCNRLSIGEHMAGNHPVAYLDPKRCDPSVFLTRTYDSVFEMEPYSFCLGQSIEYIRIPRDVLGVAWGKSTYARVGISVNITPLEPEWEGYLTIEISNMTGAWVKIYPGEGIAQLTFFRADEPCQVSYADKKGKYQQQPGIVLAKV